MNGEDQSCNCEYVIRAHQLCMDLNNIMLLINTTHDVELILREVVQESCKALGCDSARIAIREGSNWVIRHVSRLPDSMLGRAYTDEDLPHAALALMTKKTVAISDAYNDSRTNTEMMKSLGIRSVLILPLIEKDQVTGTLLFGYSTITSFNDTEIDYAERVSTGVAIALRNARLYQEIEETNKLSNILNDIGSIIHSTQDYDAIMKTILQMAAEALAVESAMMFCREEDHWVARYVYKLPATLIGRSFSGQEVLHTTITAETKKAMAISDTAHSPNVDQSFVQMLGIRSLLDFPLIVHGLVIGDLAFHYHTSPVPFNERQIEFVRKLQNSISLALENARLISASRQSEHRLKEAEKLGKFGYFHFDIRTRKITWSEGMFLIFKRDFMAGAPSLEDFFELYCIEPGLEEMQKLVGDEDSCDFGARMKRNDEVLDVHISVRSMRNTRGELVARFGTIQDVTELKRSERLVREKESFAQAILDSLPAHIAVLDPDGIILAVNRSWMRFAEENGGTVPQISSGADYLAVCRHASDMSDPHAQAALAGLEGVLRKSSLGFAEIYPCHSPSQQRWFLMNVVRPHHQFEGAVVTHTDISEQIKAENEVQEANRELQAFNYTAAHDLRQPLNVICGYCQTVEMHCGNRLCEKCGEYIQEIYHGGLRMNNLIDTLLRFARMSQTELRRERINLSQLARSVADQLEAAEPGRRVEFRIAEGLTVIGDGNLVRIVLENLIGNAWKFTSNMGNGVIECGRDQVKNKVVFFIRDNGAGFEMADAHKLFLPFQRLPGAEQYGGHGIGLATVEKIIRRHGGDVWAEGKPGSGATFYFTLPVPGD